MKKTGIIGGTFDPVHKAHLKIADAAYKEVGLDRVLFMPSPNPPHKNEDELTDINHRVNMLKLALEPYEYFEFSDFEFNRVNQGTVYSADTLTEYKNTYPEEELYFIIGSDSLYSIESWYHPEIIFQKATIVVAKRKDASADKLMSKIIWLKENYNINIIELDVNASDISSTKIRQLTAETKDDIPESVWQYIVKNNLYREHKGSKRWTIAEIIAELKTVLKPERFKHTLDVAETAKKMAESLGENPNKAYLAGLLHDCTKYMTFQENVDICSENSITVSKSEMDNPQLLHAKTGAVIAKSKYHITDSYILEAIKYHTTGRPEMSLLEKIIFTADYIEPGRNKQPRLDILRQLAYTDIDKTVYLILEDTLNYLREKGYENIDEFTSKSYEYYKNLINNR